MSSQTQNAGTAIDSGSANPWTSASSATGAADGTFASSAFSSSPSNSNTDNLQLTNYGFTIPGGATINGYIVTITKKADTASGKSSIVDNVVQLMHGGSTIGSSKADGSTFWPTTSTAVTYGTSSDVWGTSLTVSQINDSTFGVEVSGIDENDNANTAYVDSVSIQVFYTGGSSAMPASLAPMFSSSVVLALPAFPNVPLSIPNVTR